MMQSHPPKWAQSLLASFCSDELIEEIEGDLLEAYQFRLKKYSKVKADYLFVIDVLRFFKPYSFQKHSRSKQFLPMFNNYIKISLRNIFTKSLHHTIINTLGIAIGIATALLIGSYVHHEVTYDKSFPNASQKYRIVNHYRDQVYACMFFGDYYSSNENTQKVLVNYLKKQENIVNACHFVPNNSSIGPNRKWYVRTGNKELVMDEIIFTNTGKSFQEMFPIEYLQGDPETAFNNYNKAIVSESTAIRIFGKSWDSQNLLGTEIRIQDESFVIAGIVKDPPSNIHFTFDLILHQDQIPSWAGYTYFEKAPSASVEDIAHQLKTQADLIYPGYGEDVLQKGFQFIPLTKIHFTQGLLYEIKAIANTTYLEIFLIVAFVILLAIWINYANLSIATYTSRQRELGVRKVLGARSKDIAYQILTESILMALLSIPIIFGLCYFLLPYLNNLLEVDLSRNLLMTPQFNLTLLSLTLLTGIIGGSYPILLYSRKSLLKLFKGKLNSQGSKNPIRTRYVLLTSQFFMLIGLMSLAIVIMQQMDFIQTKSKGFDSEGIVYFNIDGAKKYQQLKQQLEQIPEIEKVGTGMVPGQDMYNQLTYKMSDHEEINADGTFIYTSLESMELYGFRSSAFQNLSNQTSRIFIINESAAKKLAAITNKDINQLIGETVILEPEWENEEFGFGHPHVIADIIPDFDYFTLKYTHQPLFIEVHNEKDTWIYNMIVKVETSNWIKTIDDMEKEYLKVEDERPLDITFLENHLERLYTKDKNAGVLTSALTFICIMISIMGLVGVVDFVVQSKRKEIGIRKVFGASIRSILQILSREYLFMIIIAGTLVTPVFWVMANRWLDGFAYHITPSLSALIPSVMITMVIITTVVVARSKKSANENPIDVLRYE